MEIWQTQELFAYWDDHPPTHIMLDRIYDLVAVVSGNKPRTRKSRSRAMNRADIEAQGIPKAAPPREAKR